MSMFSNGASPLQFFEVTDSRSGEIRSKRRQPLQFGDEKSRTHQEFLESSDINNIMKRYRVTGLMPMTKREPLFGDFSELPTYQEALNTVISAQQGFAALPSNVRDRFHNDPEEFLKFVHTEGNDDELRKLGLIIDPPKKPASLDDVVDVLKASDAQRSGANTPSEGS